MKRTHALAGVGLWLSLALTAAPVFAQTPADNTKANAKGQLSADAQKNNSDDLTTTRNIRRSILAEKNISTYAQNVKVITENGRVTLKGPVRTDAERTMIAAKAAAVAGADHVVNELTVAPAKN